MILSRHAPKVRKPIRFRGIAVQAVVIALAGFALAHGVESAPPTGPLDPLAGISIDNLSRQSSLAMTMYLVDDPVFYAQSAGGRDSTAGMYGYESKSPKRAFAQSFLIPGWGQWYNGSRIKPFIFLGLEAAGWVGVSHFHNQGQKKQGVYQRFADDPVGGWGYQRYLDGLKAVYGVDSDTMRYINPAWEHCTEPGCKFDTTNKYTVFSHHIDTDADGNPIKNQTYYENVGKYDQFALGWRDFKDGQTITNPDDTIGVEFLTAHRESYLNQRADANREYSRASTILIVTFGNHLLSAFEAALGAARHNKSMDQFGTVSAHLRLARSGTDGKLYPKLYVGYRF
jgi:hypothetical protein